jgi:hypothetical protein
MVTSSQAFDTSFWRDNAGKISLSVKDGQILFWLCGDEQTAEIGRVPLFQFIQLMAISTGKSQ